MRSRIFSVMVFLCLSFLWIHCDKSTDPLIPQTLGSLEGSVKAGEDLLVNHPAYLFYQDSLVAVSDEDGFYLIHNLPEGTLDVLCSSLGFGDVTAYVDIVAGETSMYDFSLTPDSSTGKVFGEFQDAGLFDEQVANNAELAGWDGKRIFDAATGATIQYKTLGYLVQNLNIMLGDSIMASSGAWGEFYFEVQCGTYPLNATGDGYVETSKVVTILPDTKHYINFFLKRLSQE